MTRKMDKWLGDGGMKIIGELGASLTDYGEGWVEGTWIPAPIACNPNGPVQGGISATVADAVMTFATLAALGRGENCSLLEMKTSYYRGMMQGDKLRIRGEVVRISRKVAFCRAIIAHDNGEVAIEATGTNLLRRAKKE